MLLITGTQRCGTSLLAEFVKRCGYPMKGDNDSVGAHDDANISMNYRKILNDHTFPWSNYPSERADDPLPALEDLDYEVAKFPFLMMHPTLMKIWLYRRGQRDRLLILVRESEKVLRSKHNTKERVEQFATDSLMLVQTPKEAKENWFDSFMLVLDSGVPYHFLKFPNFVDNWPFVLTALNVFGGLDKVRPHDEDLWYCTVDKTRITAG